MDDNQRPIKELPIETLNYPLAYNKADVNDKASDAAHPIIESDEHLDSIQQADIVSISGAFTDKKGSSLKRKQWKKRKKLQRSRQKGIEKSKEKAQPIELVQPEHICEDLGEYTVIRIQDPELIEKILLLEKIQNTIIHIFDNPMDSFTSYKEFRKNNMPMLFEGLIAQFLVKQILNDDELIKSNGKVRLYIIQVLNGLSDHVQATLETDFFGRIYLKDKLVLINLFYYLKLRIAIAHLVYIGKKCSSGFVKKGFLRQHVEHYKVAQSALKIKWELTVELSDDYLKELMETYNFMLDRFPMLANYFNSQKSFIKK
jgi:hypothetical protein